MQLKKGETTYYFAIPLLEIWIKEYDLHVDKQYAFGSFYYPSRYQDPDDFLYLIKVYDFFNESSNQDVEFIGQQKLLFGESRYIPFIVNRGEMKWISLGNKFEDRNLEDFPDLKLSSLNMNVKQEDRNWFLLKNAGLNGQHWNQYQRPFHEIKHLEYGDELNEVLVKFRIYIILLNRTFTSKQILLNIEEWKKLLLDIIVREPSTKKTKPEIIKNEFIENYLIDYLT